MSNTSTVTVACALCVGAARELYLAAALAAIAHAVDALAVNDNSGLAHSDNVATLETSSFAMRGALQIARHPFADFADMRNRAFAALGTLPRLPDWVLFLDADEVHGAQIRYIAREILPRLPASIGSVDAYTYHFFGTFGWITDIARRFVFYRYDPKIAWVNAVHEKVVGVRGASLVLPYVYHHYGNVAPPAMLARKHGRYFELGNPVPRPPVPAAATPEMYLAKSGDVRPYRGPHPVAARATLAALQIEFGADFEAVEAGFAAGRSSRMKALAALRGLNENVRVLLRRFEHPGIYAAPTRGR